MKRDWWNKEFRWLVAVGESITAGGWASSRERGWAALLAGAISEYQRVPVQLINAGMGANVISPRSPGYAYSSKPSLSERVDRHIPDMTANGHPVEPDLVVLSYGLNDARSGTAVESFCTEMEDVIKRIRQRFEPLIVLVGPYFMTDFQLGGAPWSHATRAALDEFNEGIRNTAGRVDALFVDLLQAYSDAPWLVHHDGVHANDLSHRVVANRIFEVLASNCSGLAQETRTLEDMAPPWRDESTLT